MPRLTSMKDLPLWCRCCFLIATLWFSLVPDAHARDAPTYRIIKQLPFSPSVPSLTLDLYQPQPQTTNVPCVIVIQGGGFAPQNGQRFKAYAEHLADAGYAAALISYRGRPRHDYRETMSDVKDAVRFVRREAGKYGIDRTRIGATGRSAGGTLAALLAMTSESTEDPARIQAAVCFAGVFDFVGRFTKEAQLKLQPNHETKIRTNGEWIAAPFAKDNARWLDASAIEHVDVNDPPVLFLHSRDDSTVPWLQSKDMHRAMVDAGVPSKAMIYESGGHGVKPKDHNSLDDMVAFFDKVLRASPGEVR